MIFSDSTVAARNFRNTESVLMSSFWTSSLGGKPPVVFQRSTWASRFRLIQLSSSLAIFFLAGSMWLGIAHAQASRQAMDLNFARGPIGNEATLIFPATLDCRSEEHTSELQSLAYLVCRLLLEKKKKPYVP